jgi:hypothetical protein
MSITKLSPQSLETFGMLLASDECDATALREKRRVEYVMAVTLHCAVSIAGYGKASWL